jgi:hypothetical protein
VAVTAKVGAKAEARAKAEVAVVCSMAAERAVVRGDQVVEGA